MSRLAIIHHSPHGHTEHIARQVHVAILDVAGVDAHPVKAEDDIKTAHMFGRHFARSLTRAMVTA